VLALAVAIAGRGAAQDGATADSLRRARDSYERLDVERALPLLRQIVAPAWPFEVTSAQRVEAYKYLGASVALAGMRDSAVFYFRAAIEREPFTDLDPHNFTPAQLALFQEARRRTFAIAVQPVAPARIDPRTERATFVALTTHAATLRVELRSPAAGTPFVLYDGDNDGPREIRWDGLLTEGRLAPPGRYEVVALGRSRVLARTDSTRVYFDLRHDLAPLQDTLPALAPGALLPEQYTRAIRTRELLAGLGVAVSAVLFSRVATSAALGRDQVARPLAVAAAVAGTGMVAFFWHRRHAEIPANVQANVQRQADRAAKNDAIRRRNADRIAATILLIAPAAGAGP